MEQQSGQALMRVRIASSHWHELKRRANARQSTIAEYANSIFTYPVHERQISPRPRSMDDPDEEIYVELEVDSRVRDELLAGSERHQTSLAGYAGLLIGSYLEHYGNDPRDLRMMHFVATRLNQTAVLSELDLLHAIQRCEINSRVRLPPGYFAKWLHGRLQPVVARVERRGESVELTVGLVEEVLSRTGERG